MNCKLCNDYLYTYNRNNYGKHDLITKCNKCGFHAEFNELNLLYFWQCRQKIDNDSFIVRSDINLSTTLIIKLVDGYYDYNNPIKINEYFELPSCADDIIKLTKSLILLNIYR